MHFCYFVIISSWKKAWPLIWWKLNPLYPKLLLVEIGPVFLEEFVIIFSLFCDYFTLGKGVALHLNKLKSLHPRMLCAKFGWNRRSGSGEEDENVKGLRTDWLSTKASHHRWRVRRASWRNMWRPQTPPRLAPCSGRFLKGRYVNLVGTFGNIRIVKYDI